MERASRLIGKLKFPNDTISSEELVTATWPVAVGKRIASHAHASRMVRSSLIVEVEDAVWQRQLFTLRQQILSKMWEHIGRGLVEDIEFRVVPMRRGPQKARKSTPSATLFDEAEQIADPVMRRIYKAARKRALA